MSNESETFFSWGAVFYPSTLPHSWHTYWMANGVVATSKALKEEKVVCVSKQEGKRVRQRDQLGYTVSKVLITFHFIHA